MCRARIRGQRCAPTSVYTSRLSWASKQGAHACRRRSTGSAWHSRRGGQENRQSSGFSWVVCVLDDGEHDERLCQYRKSADLNGIESWGSLIMFFNAQGQMPMSALLHHEHKEGASPPGLWCISNILCPSSQAERALITKRQRRKRRRLGRLLSPYCYIASRGTKVTSSSPRSEQ